jgi:hypothetical protein
MFLHFFRVSSWSLDVLISCWCAFVLSQNQTVCCNGRAVLLGDHTNVAKDGRRMPCVVTMHQHSETQSKPSYFRGHFWGSISVLIGSLTNPFSIPLALGIHQGLAHVGKDDKEEDSSKTLGKRIVQMAIDFAAKFDQPSVLTLDAFFPEGAVFKLAQSIWSIKYRCPLVTLIIRAKKNFVAYFEAEQPKGKRPVGRPATYGEKVKLIELFDHVELFSKEKCCVYGKIEEVSMAALDLLWKPTGSLIRFVLAVTSRGPIVLMCSDLSQNPIAALELYCARVRIETMFDMLKNLMGAFRYRFWTKRLPRHSRKPTKNKYLKSPAQKDLSTVKRCFAAYERFVMIGAIALGLMQLISLKFEQSVWQRFLGFLRTRSRMLPSERTVKHVVGNLLAQNLANPACDAMIREIQAQCRNKKIRFQRANSPPEPEQALFEAEETV